ncbi:TetR/AcrR family transcriptional regulator [Pseudooceanicola algae]|uniref:Uncharacterized protein n=1 Tax=Pseudooceanicola algae TaxID=1537215 RepID=A0A418SK36_9RHOB|nr:TetR/AcrR family transcriptional regulator [Pseudooceanicola algae]QPM89170.1 hypothetical protein PSAL_003810 [Pseudooceanicola algae]
MMNDRDPETRARKPAEPADTNAQKRRHAAGEDPQKRRQILDGAWRIFVDQGFDAASMNNICKAAGVSKGTLYVYFDNKEDLFVALVEDRRDGVFDGIAAELTEAGTVEDRLMAYAKGLARKMGSRDMIHAQRIVIAVVERMPELGTRFYDAGASHFLTCLRDFLEQETEAGHLEVPDPGFAAQQLVELSTASIWRSRLFGRCLDEPSEAEIQRVAQAAVTMFLGVYRA